MTLTELRHPRRRHPLPDQPGERPATARAGRGHRPRAARPDHLRPPAAGQPRRSPTAGNIRALTLTYYDGPAFEGMPSGQLGDWGLRTRVERLSLTPEILTAAYPATHRSRCLPTSAGHLRLDRRIPAGVPGPLPRWAATSTTPTRPTTWRAGTPSTNGSPTTSSRRPAAGDSSRHGVTRSATTPSSPTTPISSCPPSHRPGRPDPHRQLRLPGAAPRPGHRPQREPIGRAGTRRWACPPGLAEHRQAWREPRATPAPSPAPSSPTT